MLVLSRRKSESILIGDDILITVITVRGKHTRLGIEAPKELAIRRLGAAPSDETPRRRPRLLAAACSCPGPTASD